MTGSPIEIQTEKIQTEEINAGGYFMLEKEEVIKNASGEYELYGHAPNDSGIKKGYSVDTGRDEKN